MRNCHTWLWARCNFPFFPADSFERGTKIFGPQLFGGQSFPYFRPRGHERGTGQGKKYNLQSKTVPSTCLFPHICTVLFHIKISRIFLGFLGIYLPSTARIYCVLFSQNSKQRKKKICCSYAQYPCILCLLTIGRNGTWVTQPVGHTKDKCHNCSSHSGICDLWLYRHRGRSKLRGPEKEAWSGMD